jgi:hypothetical protein
MVVGILKDIVCVPSLFEKKVFLCGEKIAGRKKFFSSSVDRLPDSGSQPPRKLLRGDHRQAAYTPH